MAYFRTLRQAEDAADFERSLGIEDRPRYDDPRPAVVPFPLALCGGKDWQAERIEGLTKYRLRDTKTERVEVVGTMKQLLRFMSGKVAHTTAARHYQ